MSKHSHSPNRVESDKPLSVFLDNGKANSDLMLETLKGFTAWWLGRFGAINDGGDGTFDAGNHDCSAPLFDKAMAAIEAAEVEAKP